MKWSVTMTDHTITISHIIVSCSTEQGANDLLMFSEAEEKISSAAENWHSMLRFHLVSFHEKCESIRTADTRLSRHTSCRDGDTTKQTRSIFFCCVGLVDKGGERRR